MIQHGVSTPWFHILISQWMFGKNKNDPLLELGEAILKKTNTLKSCDTVPLTGWLPPEIFLNLTFTGFRGHFGTILKVDLAKKVF